MFKRRPVLLVFSLLLASSSGAAQDRVRGLSDLEGAKVGDGMREMRSRGYTYVWNEVSGRDQYEYFRENRSNRCVTVHVRDGRYDSLVYVPNPDCDRHSSSNRSSYRGGGSSGGRYGGGGNVDYPRVNVDTAGRGNYNGPGFNEPRIDRGYVDTTGSRVKIGMSVKSGFRIMLYGRIAREVGDREFEVDIDDSDDGRASGHGRFRLNKDRNEVEMIDFDARIRGDRVSGRFNRS